MKTSFFFAVVALAAGCLAAAPDRAKTLLTAAGKLEVGGKDAAGRCPVLLGGKAVTKLDCQASYPPRILGHFKGAFGRFPEVVVLQEQPMGNACNGGPLHFLGIRKDGGLLAGPVDFCGGADPILKQDGSRVMVTMPGGAPNRGAVAVASEVWQYEDGRVAKVK